jgi:predicted ATPase
MKAYIITGAPGTGKTSIINELSKTGILGLEEIPRKLIKNKIAEKMGISPFTDLKSFFNLVFNEMHKQYQDLYSYPEKIKENSSYKYCFFDRAMPDVLGYSYKSKITFSQNKINIIRKSNYEKTVFFCPLWEEIYTTDAERPYPIEEIKLLDKNLFNAYTNLGFHIDILPKTSIRQRIKYILDRI